MLCNNNASVNVVEHIVRLKEQGSLAAKRGGKKDSHRSDDHEQAKKGRKLRLCEKDRASKRPSVFHLFFDRGLFATLLSRGGNVLALRLFRVSDRMICLHGAVKNADMPGCMLGHLVEIMRNNDQKLLRRNLLEQSNDLLGGLGIQVSGRLVREDDGAVLRKGARNHRSLLLSARKLASLMVGVRFEANAADQLHRACAALGLVLNVHQSQLHVLKNREAFNYIIILEDKGDVFLAVVLPIGLHIVRGGLSLNEKLALLVGVHSADHV